MTKINPYLTFNGNAETAMLFYKSVFGGEFAAFSRFRDTANEHNPIPEASLDKIMHIAYPINAETVLMASDTHPASPQITMGDNISLAIATDSKASADQIFNGLAANGTVTMPITDAPWGAYFGMLRDQFGIAWLINYDYPAA